MLNGNKSLPAFFATQINHCNLASVRIQMRPHTDRGKHWNRLERPPKLECLGAIVSESFVEWIRKDIRIIAIWADKRWNCLSVLRTRSEFSSSSVPSADRSGTMCLSVQWKIGLATLLNNLNALP